MMKKKAIVGAIACLTLLSACDKLPVGADSGSESGVGNSSSEKMDRERSISRSGSSASSITMPASVLLAQAAKKLIEKPDLYLQLAGYWGVAQGQAFFMIAEEFGKEGDINFEEMTEEEIDAWGKARLNKKDEIERIVISREIEKQPAVCEGHSNSELLEAALIASGSELPFFGDVMFVSDMSSLDKLDEIGLLDEDDEGEEDDEEIKNYNERASLNRKKITEALTKLCGKETFSLQDKRLGYLINYANSSCRGWPSLGAGEINGNFARGKARKAERANYVSAIVLSELKDLTLKNPAHAQEIMINKLIELARNNDFINSMVEVSRANEGYGITINMAGSAEPVEFSRDDGSAFTCGNSGLKMYSHGVHYYGGGKIMGQDMLLTLESAVNVSETRSSGSSSSSDSSSGSSSGARGGTQ